MATGEDDEFGFGHEKFEVAAEAKTEGKLGIHFPLMVTNWEWVRSAK